MPEDTIISSSDAYLDELYPTKKVGTWTLLRVCPYLGYRYRSLVFFDLAVLPPGTTINSAKLYLHCYARDGDGAIGRTLKLRRILQDWAESSVNWDTAPSHSDAVSASATVPSSLTWMEWDVKADIEKFLSGEEENKGWIVMDEDASSGVTDGVRFRSHEADINPPRLVVNHTGIPPIQVNLNDQLAVQGSVTDSWKYKGLGKRLWESVPIHDRPGFKLNGKILVFLHDQLTAVDKVSIKAPISNETNISPSDDARIYQNSPGTNYGSLTYLQFTDAEDSESRNLLKFNLSSIPSNATNITAKLYLYFYTTMELWGSNLDQDVFRVTEAWNEGAVTWTNQPAIAGTRTSVTTLIDDQNGWYYWDVSDDVADFIAETYTNYGWMLKPHLLSGNLDQRAYSKETSASQKPYLYVSYLSGNKFYRALYDQVLINDILNKADTKSQYHRGLSDNLTPISDSLSIRRIPRSLLSDIDLSPAQVIRQEYPVSDIVPEDEVLTVYIETADGQKWTRKLQPL